MTTPVAFPAKATGLTGSAPARQPAEEGGKAVAGAKAPAAPTADYRLVIEQDESTGAFVYKTLDRRTGEVVQQFPREEVLRLYEDPGYAPGDVIKTRS